MKHVTAKRVSSEDRGWPISLARLNSVPHQVKKVASVFLILIITFLVFLTFVALVRIAFDLLSNDPQRATEAIKSLLPLAAAAVGLPLIIWRLRILSKQTTISEAQAQIDRETHYTSIFSKSVEQLGQTKEIKESRYRNDALETITRTVANIEVRLGGIHSLTRLAEESERDIRKILNMLLSYVRENSWSDREGLTIESAPKPTLRPFDWSYDCVQNAVSEKTRGELASYREQCQRKLQEITEWQAPLTDTRVDVNEAVDAILSVILGSDTKAPNLFYECLIVGRSFRNELLAIAKFERCTFVRCQFNIEGLKEINLRNSVFIDCRFDIHGSEVALTRCALIRSQFLSTRSKIHITYSDLIDCTGKFSGDQILLRNTDFETGSWDGSEQSEIKVVGNLVTFAGFHFWDFKFAAGSSLGTAAFGDVYFRNVDLSEVEIGDNCSLAITKASPKTIHPNSMNRPESWPAYGPNYVDDEIPF